MKSNFLSSSSISTENVYPSNYFYPQNLDSTTTTSTGEKNSSEDISNVSQEDPVQAVKENNNLRDINNG